jgi:transglutaminase superfamily protein
LSGKLPDRQTADEFQDAARQMISFAILDGRAVFMDEDADSYFLLDGATEEHLCELLRTDVPLASDPRLLEALGITGGTCEVVRTKRAAPSASLVDEDCPSSPVRIFDVLKITKLLVQTRLRLRRLPIGKLLWHVTKGRPGTAPGNGVNAGARRFATARRFVPVKRNCLVDSLALLQWLDLEPQQPELVFGVKLDPFAAHCWVQRDDLVLNDSIESLLAFTPVRVIPCSVHTL